MNACLNEHCARRRGQAGTWVSDMLPYTSGVADDIAVVTTCATNLFNHAPAKLFMNTGSGQFGRPSLGAWATYGIGSEANDLPGFVVLQSGPRGPRGGAVNWGSGFLPSSYQGVPFSSGPQPIFDVASQPGVTADRQRRAIDALKDLNREHQSVTGDPEINTRIASYEMAFRMQSSAPELMDISKESQETLDLYGATPGKGGFANNCLLARRLIERGVRFVQLFHPDWDHHSRLTSWCTARCRDTDQPSAGLVMDLAQPAPARQSAPAATPGSKTGAPC